MNIVREPESSKLYKWKSDKFKMTGFLIFQSIFNHHFSTFYQLNIILSVCDILSKHQSRPAFYQRYWIVVSSPREELIKVSRTSIKCCFMKLIKRQSSYLFSHYTTETPTDFFVCGWQKHAVFCLFFSHYIFAFLLKWGKHVAAYSNYTFFDLQKAIV